MKIKHIAIVVSIASFLALFACHDRNNKELKHLTVQSGPVKIAYDLKGSGDTLVVFVHGWAINKSYWQSQIDTFSNRFQVAALDLGGHGESGRNRNSWSVYDYANDVIALIDTLKANKVILIGHSMSGDVIAAVADSIPQKIVGFVGIDNFKDVSTTRSQQEENDIQSFIAALHSSYDSIIQMYCYNGLFPPHYPDTPMIKRVLRDLLKTDTTVSILTMQTMAQTSLGEGDRLKKVNLPVHVITSAYSPINIEVESKYCVKGLREKVINGTGHYPMIEKPGEFNRLLSAVFDEVAVGR